MKTLSAVCILLCVACVGPGQIRKLTDSEIVRVGSTLADSVISQVAPPLARVEGALDGFNAGLTNIEAKRIEHGEDPEAPMGWTEWLFIASAALNGALGINTARDKKKIKALQNGS